MAKKITISDLKFPFHVTRITTTQDENGDNVTSDESWDSYCGYKQMSSYTKSEFEVPLDTEAIDITYRFLPERLMQVNDKVTFLSKEWNHFGTPRFNDVGHIRYVTQSLRHG